MRKTRQEKVEDAALVLAGCALGFTLVVLLVLIFSP